MSPASRGDLDKYTQSSIYQQIRWSTTLFSPFAPSLRFLTSKTTNPAAIRDGINQCIVDVGAP